MIRIAIVEDDKAFMNRIKKYIDTYVMENDVEIDVSCFSDGSELVSDYEPVYDILLMDIEMPRMNGMDAAKVVRRTDDRVIIIFITNMAQYAINGYEVGALDYVLKPVKYFPFSMKLTKAVSSIRESEAVSLLVPYETGVRKVMSDDIIYAEIRDHWLHIITKSQEYKMLGTLKEFANKFEEKHFTCCNHCFCINLKYVTSLEKETVELDGRYELKVSRSRKKQLKQALLDYYKGGLR